MHFHGTGGWSECCDVSPFDTMNASGNWTAGRVMAIQDDSVILRSSDTIFGVHFQWENFPQCALYNGDGGPDGHQALPAPPAEWCAYPTPGEHPWNAVQQTHQISEDSS